MSGVGSMQQTAAFFLIASLIQVLQSWIMFNFKEELIFYMEKKGLHTVGEGTVKV